MLQRLQGSAPDRRRDRAARAVLALGLLLGAAGATAQAFSHDRFDRLLSAHVHDGFVDYGAFAASQDFERYLESLARAQPETLPSRGHRLAFYLNAYNALAIRGILDGSSPDGFLSRIDYFKLDKYPLAGEEISLYDLEHEVVLPLGEPRAHFALVCASESCPPLRSEAYAAERLDLQLDEQARLFINDTRKNRFEVSQGVARVSKIFDWFEDDFEAAAGGVDRYIADFVADPEAAAALRQGALAIEHLDYDWSLNGSEP